jgi:hypothetical protein
VAFTSQTYAFINQQTLSKYYIEPLGEPKLLRFLEKTVTGALTFEKLDVHSNRQAHQIGQGW